MQLSPEEIICIKCINISEDTQEMPEPAYFLGKIRKIYFKMSSEFFSQYELRKSADYM